MSMDERTNDGNRAPREELVQHLVRCMEEQGLTVEAADARGYRRPRLVKLFGLRSSRLRPDVIAKDGRRTVFGAVKCGSEIAEAHLADHLENLASKCRLLVVCIPEAAAEAAMDSLFRGAPMPQRQKIRLLRYPKTRWEDIPKSAVRKVHRPDPSTLVHVRDEQAGDYY
jgi:hypothetical protein